MDILRVMLFGGVRITHDNWLTEVILPRDIQALLAYLLLQRHRHHSRDVLAGVFWGEYSQERARGSLNTAIWKLKKALEPEEVSPGTYLDNDYPGEIGFNIDSRYWLDIEVFEGEANRILKYPFQALEEPHVVDLENVIELYRGEMLEGFYDNWALWERERLRALYLKSLIYLMQYYGFHKEYEKAIFYGQKILSLEPLMEEIHCEMMRLYMENGERSLALRQYEICRSMLSENYGLSPMDETHSLYMQIISDGKSSRAAISSEQISFDQALKQLTEASHAIELAKEQIQHTLRLIAKSSEHSEKTVSLKVKNECKFRTKRENSF